MHGVKLEGVEFVEDALVRGAVAVASARERPIQFPENATWIELAAGLGAARAGARGGEFLRASGGRVEARGRHRNEREDDDRVPGGFDLRAAGFTDGLIGTTGYRTPKGALPAPNTTPESLDLQQIFAEIRDARGTHVVLEASSHALAMERLSGCHFAAAIFTNLTRDHLDYHKTFEEYFAAKRLLFAGTGAGAPDAGVINVDDPYGAQLAGLARRTLTYGLKNAADLTAKKFALSFDGLEFTAQTPAGNIEVRSPLVGRINVYNILAAIGAGIALDIPNAKIEQGIANLELVPGRFQRIDEGQPFLVVVDYAHTDDALRNLIATARELSTSGRIITVFGAGGERDRTQAAADGRSGGIVERSGGADERQPAQRGPAAHHQRCGRWDCRKWTRNTELSRTASGRSKWRSKRRGRETSCCWRGRDTRRTRCCEAEQSNSTTGKRRGPSCAQKGFAKQASAHESRN